MLSVFSKTAAQKQIKYKKHFITFHFLSIVTNLTIKVDLAE